MQHLALVIRKHPDGHSYVPFDNQPDGSPHPHRGAFLDALIQSGHTFELTAEGHAKLLTGPHA